MSTLAAARADNFYYPAWWDPSRSKNEQTRSRGRNQYEQSGIVRVELPWNAWCEGCGRHIGRGKRFNALKEKNGKYYTTTLWRFSFKCSCGEELVLCTDPERRDYRGQGGLRRKAEDYEGDVVDDRVKTPMERLETKKARAIVTRARSDDVLLNSLARKRHREKRKAEDALDQERKRLGLPFKLLSE